MKLFHGTPDKNVNSIKSNGFNRDFNQRFVYGKGVYFARDALISKDYTIEDTNKHRLMFFCDVLLGDYCQGAANLLTPPLKSDNQTQYDTLVNDMQNPSIFVVCKDHMAIPRYLIKFAQK